MMTERKYWHGVRREAQIAAALDAMVAANNGNPIELRTPGHAIPERPEVRARNAEYKRRTKAQAKARMALEASTEAAGGDLGVGSISTSQESERPLAVPLEGL